MKIMLINPRRAELTGRGQSSVVSGQISFGPFPIFITTHVAFYVQSRRDFNGQSD